jgi:hypothetical protein
MSPGVREKLARVAPGFVNELFDVRKPLVVAE